MSINGMTAATDEFTAEVKKSKMDGCTGWCNSTI